MSRVSRAVLACAAASALLSGCASQKPVLPTDVPAALRVSADQKLTAMLHATGVQIYQCTASAQTPARYSWIFQAPAAELADRKGKDVARHYEGPTWEGDDGSKVVGEVVARDPGPAPNAIAWLLLRSKSNTGKKGIFAKTQSIQRLHTIGGVTPDGACDASHAGQRARVAYSADYYFYNSRR
jgi:hypothetical protein